MKGASISNGDSTPTGPDKPIWLSGWEMRELWDTKTSIWTVMS
jgi:hypothetical protein